MGGGGPRVIPPILLGPEPADSQIPYWRGEGILECAYLGSTLPPKFGCNMVREPIRVNGSLQEYRLFLQEFWRTYHTTGAILPSSRSLGKALARYVAAEDKPQWVLEVGPGTGAVTRWILPRMRPADRLDLVELNDRFVARLRERFESDASFCKLQPQVRIFHAPIQQMPETQKYDVVISGLPLNNFQVAEVQEILEKMISLLQPGGVLSFFEYIGIRKLKAFVVGRTDRQRLRGIEQVFQELFRRAEIRRDWVWWNVPPAWVHHLRPSLRTSPDTGAPERCQCQDSKPYPESEKRKADCEDSDS